MYACRTGGACSTAVFDDDNRNLGHISASVLPMVLRTLLGTVRAASPVVAVLRMPLVAAINAFTATVLDTPEMSLGPAYACLLMARLRQGHSPQLPPC